MLTTFEHTIMMEYSAWFFEHYGREVFCPLTGPEYQHCIKKFWEMKLNGPC